MTSNLTGKREYEDSDGVFKLTPGRTYSYNATCYGYVGQTGSFTVPQGGGSLEITLVQAPANDTIQNLPAQWPHLRTDNNNNGVMMRYCTGLQKLVKDLIRMPVRRRLL